ncbi:helix-turn-helix domain-containing protein [Sphingomonas daechungensis]|uniref:Helix-turn-helix domain-containing protein n=1 Tax=Sphingomonas daechungensis TaxID=1176646 RepID=A0ABX6SZG4_9SPHN|nr:helix-turn-helix domain-containing protein [Sphingomonas daechungensis]
MAQPGPCHRSPVLGLGTGARSHYPVRRGPTKRRLFDGLKFSAADLDRELAKLGAGSAELFPDDSFVSVNDAMAQLGIGRTKLYELIGAEQLATMSIGSRRMISRNSINAFIAGRPGSPPLSN